MKKYSDSEFKTQSQILQLTNNVLFRILDYNNIHAN